MDDAPASLAKTARRWSRLAGRKPSVENHRKAAEAHRAAAEAYRLGRGGPVAKAHRGLADEHDAAAAVLGETMTMADHQPTQLDLGVGDFHKAGGGGTTGPADKRAARKAQKLAAKQAREAQKLKQKKDRRERVPSSIHIRADIAPGGAIHVRHTLKFSAGEGQTVLLALQEAGTDEAPQAVWIQLARQGSFAGHPSGRPFKLDARIFTQMITNFRANKDGRLPIDFEHASEQAATEGSIPQGGAPAQGWIVDLAMRDDGNLYAKVEWGTLARQYIREKKYQFISPAIHFAMKDRESGREIGAYLSSAGLTNQPFLDGMRPLAARATPTGADVQLAGRDPMAQTLKAPGEYMGELRACLGLHELATHADCSAQLERLSERCSLMDASFNHEGVNIKDKYLNGLATCAGLGGNPSVQDILDAVEDMIDAAIAEHVEEYHDGGNMRMSAQQSADTTTTNTPAKPEEDTAMEPKTTELTAKITSLEGEVTTMGTKLAGKDTELTTLTQKLTTLTGSVGEVVTLCKSAGFEPKEGEGLKELVTHILEANKVLLKAKTDREESDVVADVERAFEHYGPNGLNRVGETQKGDLLTMRRESPKSFQALYKPLTNDEIRLLKRATPREPPRKPAPQIDPNDPVLMSHTALTSHLMNSEKLGYGEAYDKAAKMIRERKPASPPAQQ